AVLRERLDVPEEVEKHIRKWKRTHTAGIPVPLKIEFDNDLSPDVTIIDIFATDQPGLLFKITRALSEEGLTIHRASISTEANRVIDSFDVQDSRGKKVTKTAKLRSVRARLVQTLG
ncbi:MAG: ACT domain-containing protein, partial [bacterium]|nr:ACT domain-containing protein [bacterium]